MPATSATATRPARAAHVDEVHQRDGLDRRVAQHRHGRRTATPGRRRRRPPARSPSRAGWSAAGPRNSPARCVTASQPANAQTNRLAAAPTPAQPCGRNGSRCGGVCATGATRARRRPRARRAPGQRELHRPGQAQPDRVGDERRQQEHGADHVHLRLRPAEHRDDVLRAEQRHDRGADAHAEEEPVPGHPGGGRPEGEPHVGRDAAGVRVPRGERGERRGQRDGQHESRRPRASEPGPAAAAASVGQQQDPGAEHGGDVQRRAERVRRCRAKPSRREPG